jgi:hypothetical protein
VGVYRVAAFSPTHYPRRGDRPEGKRHAFLDGARTTVCGFGLSGMQTFVHLEFELENPADQCRQCARTVSAAGR